MEHLQLWVFSTTYLYVLAHGVALALAFVTLPVTIPSYVLYRITRPRHRAR